MVVSLARCQNVKMVPVDVVASCFNVISNCDQQLCKIKEIFFDVDIVVKNKSKCGLSWIVLRIDNDAHHCSFPKHFFRIVSACSASLQKFLKGKSDAQAVLDTTRRACREKFSHGLIFI